MTDDESQEETPPHHDTRTQLIVDVVVLQLKLAVGGVRDLLLIPVSIAAAIVGLFIGGEEPDVYFRQVQRFGRRSDLWLNVFGSRHRGNTADEMIRPLEESLMAQMRRGGRLNRGARHVNELLDNVNQKQARKNPPRPDGEA
jgi:hypothetical protein